MTLRLTVDPSRCTGQGLCYSVVVGLLDGDDDGVAVPRGTPVDVPAGREDDAYRLEYVCPESAITRHRGLTGAPRHQSWCG